MSYSLKRLEQETVDAHSPEKRCRRHAAAS